VAVNVLLIDLNDEPPIFEKQLYEFSTLERKPSGRLLGGVKANDRDAFDIVT
jgi:hypothetical protein